MKRMESLRSILLMLLSSLVILGDSVCMQKAFGQPSIDINFLFMDRGNIYCTANERGFALMQTISEGLDFRELLEEHDYGPAPLPPQTEKWAMERLGLRYGEKVLGIIPAEEIMLVLETEGLALRPSGDGWFSGLLARLTTQSITELSNDAISRNMIHRPVGVSWRLGDTRSGLLRILAETEALSEGRQREFQEDLEETTDIGGELGRVFLLDVPGSAGVYIFESTREDASVILFTFYHDEEGLKQAPFFYPASTTSEPYLLLEAGRPDSDVAMHSTTYSILADITGNSLPELFVRSTVSYLFSLEEVSGNYQWRMLRSYYRGP